MTFPLPWPKSWSKQVIYSLGALVIITLVGLLGSSPLFHSGLYTAHDIWHQVARAHHYYRIVLSGQFPPYWVSELSNGFGYPLFFFSYHGPWLIGLPLALLHAPTEVIIKVLFGLSLILSGITMYLLGRSLFSSRASAIMMAILYMWAPYHFLTLYVSAAIGTAFAFSFLPLIFTGLLLAARQGQATKSIIYLTLGSAGIILSHLITFVMLVPFLALGVMYVLLSQKRGVSVSKTTLILIAGSLLSIGLSLFYLLPAAYYNHFTVISSQAGFQDIYKGNLVNFNQIAYSRWGFGPITSSAKDGEISLQLGLGQWLAILSSLGIYVWSLVTKRRVMQSSLLFFCLCGLGLSFHLMTDASLNLWGFASKYVTVDYPFRLLLIGVFFASLCGGWVTHQLEYVINSWSGLGTLVRKFLYAGFLCLMIVVTWYTNRNYVRVNMYTDVPEWLYVAAETTTNTFHEYLPQRANRELIVKSQAPLIFASSVSPVTIIEEQVTPTAMMTKVRLDQPSKLSLRQFDFPGQTLLIDGMVVPHESEKDGLVQASLTEGEHQLRVEFRPTLVILVSLFTSLVAVVILVSLTTRVIIASRRHI